ncbi:MAG TPA: hypothetical protein VIT91_00940 [Chthoniobacterales bacterium]
MQRSRISPRKAFVVLLTAIAWLTVSNHCALAATVFSLKSESVSLCNACHDENDVQSQSKSKSDAGKSGGIACCKVLKATASDLKTSSVPQQLPSGSFDYATVLERNFSVNDVRLETAMSTGPPGARSFAELVLNRSLLAHAPPVFAPRT